MSIRYSSGFFILLLMLCVFALVVIPADAKCNPGYSLCNGKCIACPSGSVLGSDCKCHKACGDSNRYCTSGSCCSGKCVGCPSGSVLGSDCKCHKACGSSQKYCTSGTCCNDRCVSCPSGSVLGSDCLCHTECGSSGQYCKSGSSCLNGKCVSCKEGYYLGKDGSCHSTQNVAARKSAASSASSETISRTYRWNYKGSSYSWKVSIPKSLYDYYKAQPHDHSKLTTYKQYAISSKDKAYLDAMITKFKESGKKKGYSESENIMNVIAFVQALPYFKDDVSTPYDEYPRYPIETLVDNGGDCEDTAILTAALLREMGYGVVLVNPTGHMAVGVKCSSCSGTYYTYEGEKYYYLETTSNNRKIGEIPDKYKNEKVRVIPLN